MKAKITRPEIERLRKAMQARVEQAQAAGNSERILPDFVWDTEVIGFGYKVTPKLRGSYIFRYRRNPQSPTKDYVIDSTGLQHPDIVRDEAKRLSLEVSEGGDPATERAGGKLRTIPLLIDAFEKAKETAGKRTARDMGKLLRRELIPAWESRPAVEIKRSDVTALLRGIHDHGYPQTANKLRRVLHSMFQWALKQEWVRANPASGVDPLAPEASRERVLTDAELVEVWNAAHVLPAPAVAAVRLFILTLQRRSEVGGMLVSELDMPGALWTISGARSKNGNPDLTQLSPQSIAILSSVPQIKDCEYRLSTDGKRPISGWSKWKKQIDAEILDARKKAARKAGEDPSKVRPMDHWTYHDLRRTGATNLGKLKTPRHVIDRVLHHSRKQAGIIATYDRFEYYDERKEALEKWSRRVAELVGA
jgi:integrase